jgi:hypothetical protein
LQFVFYLGRAVDDGDMACGVFWDAPCMYYCEQKKWDIKFLSVLKNSM